MGFVAAGADAAWDSEKVTQVDQLLGRFSTSRSL
jgi:hypothetical protein